MKTVFVVGAGSTAFLDIPTSAMQNKLLSNFGEIATESGKTDAGEDLKRKFRIIMDGTFGRGNYTVNDVYNILDSNLLLHNALQYGETKIESYELEKCKREIIAFFFSEILEKIKESVGGDGHRKLVSFYRSLAEAELERKVHTDVSNRENFISSYSIINFNWDLYSLLPIIEAHDELNHINDRYLPVGRNPQLRIFTDFNCEYASAESGSGLWYPFTESAAFIANSEKYDTKRRILLVKCFFPHGSMNLFKCSSCAKHSYYLGDLTVKGVADALDHQNARFPYKCPYCNAEINTSDFDVLAQSNFKVRNSFLEETRLSMMKELRDATRLVFIGYSMPNDDTDYITMFKSLYKSVKEVFVVSYAKGATNDFLSYEKLPECKEKDGLKNFDSVFKEKARYNMAGFPQAADKILRVCR